MERAIEAQKQTLKIDSLTEFGLRLARLNDRLARYIPPREMWTPADKAFFRPFDLYRVPLEETRALQLKAITHAFPHHCHKSCRYHEHCTTQRVSPGYIKTGYGESGRFAYLDALAESYPGFIVTGDQVRMYEHCPACNRPGPVLEPDSPCQRRRSARMSRRTTENSSN